MEILILTIFFIFYILYNEIHKLKLKNEKKEFQIPRTFYENLKDTIQYIDYSLEATKQKQENINKIYLKILEIKKQLDEIQNTKSKRVSKKTMKHKEISEVNPKIKKEPVSQTSDTENSFIEKLLQDSGNDKIEFSFQKEYDESVNSVNSESKTINSNQYTVFERIGKFFRKTLQIPEIPVTEIYQKDKETKENGSKEILITPITLEDYEKQIKTDITTSEESTQKIESSNKIIQDNNNQHEPAILENNKNIDQIQNKQMDRDDAREIVILETKKIYSEITNKEKQLQFIKKLIEIGFTNDEIHQITEVPLAEIILIAKIQKRKGNEFNVS